MSDTERQTMLSESRDTPCPGRPALERIDTRASEVGELPISPLVGLDLAAAGPARMDLPLEPDLEHAVLVLSGAARVDNGPLSPDTLVYLGSGRWHLELECRAASHSASRSCCGGISSPAGLAPPRRRSTRSRR